MYETTKKIFLLLFLTTFAGSVLGDEGSPVSASLEIVPSRILPFQPPELRLTLTNHTSQAMLLPKYFRLKVTTAEGNEFLAYVPYAAIETDNPGPEDFVLGDAQQIFDSRELKPGEKRLVSFVPRDFFSRGFFIDPRLHQPGRYTLALGFTSDPPRDSRPTVEQVVKDFWGSSHDVTVAEPEGEDQKVLAAIRMLFTPRGRAGIMEVTKLARNIWAEHRSSSYAPYVVALVPSAGDTPLEQIEILEEGLRLSRGTPTHGRIREGLGVTLTSRADELMTARDASGANRYFAEARRILEEIMASGGHERSRREGLVEQLERIHTPAQVGEIMRGDP